MNGSKPDLGNSKVCHITTVHPTEDVRIFHKECRSLKAAGFDVTLLTNAPGEKDRVLDGVRIHCLSTPYGSRVGRMYKVPRAIYRSALAIDADIYHFHDPDFLPYARKLVKKGKTVFYDVHEDVPRQILAKFWIPKPLRKLVSTLFEQYEDRVAAKFSGILTATDHIRDRFLQKNPRVESVKNYPMLEHYDLPERGGEAGDRICYIGSITEVRGIAEIVKALPKTNAELDLAGNFEDTGFREDLRKLPGWDQVNELGFIGRDKVNEVLKEASVGMVTLHPVINYLDALPVKMFEYMAAGIPVIASDFPILKGIVEQKECGFCVDPLDPKKIAEAINELLQDPEKAQEMGKRGRKAVEEVYNWQKEAEKLTAFYEASIEGPLGSERTDREAPSSRA